ncbi:MAG: hypothetical protein KA508_00525 [Gammaproteobacteria bacterium]|nr:hypothetical protein [Gammaproteobacteria bacterium]
MPYLNLSHYALFLNTQLRVHVFLRENHAKMQALLEAMLVRPWAKKLVAEAYLKKLLHTLKEAETMNQKESRYLLEHRSYLKSLAQADIRVIGYSNYCLISNSQNNLHLFLKERYLRIQCLLAMMSSKGVLKNRHSAQKGMEIFSKYLTISHETSKTILKILEKITSVCEKISLTDRRAIDVPGSTQFYNLMTYCNRWGQKAHDA